MTSGQLRSDPETGTASIVSEKLPPIVISPAVAVDADGRAIRAEIKVDGDRLILQVEHRDSNPRYPILVDPTVIDSNLRSEDDFETHPGFRGWLYWEGYQDANGYPHQQDNAYDPSYGQLFGSGSNTGGLFVTVPAPSVWAARTHGAWYVSVPNWDGIGTTTAYYNYVKFDHPTLSSNAGGPYPNLDFGLFDWNSGLYTDRQSYYGTQGSPAYWIGPTAARAVKPQRINFDVTTGGSGAYLNTGQTRTAYLGGVTTYLADQESPSASGASQTPASDSNDWIKTPPAGATFTYTADDGGLGVKTMKFEAGPSPTQTPVTQAIQMPAPVGSPPPACEGWHTYTACPEHPGARTFTYDAGSLNQGINNLYAHPVDAVDKTVQPKLGEMRIDTEGPLVTVTGGLKVPSAPGRDLHVEATDGSASSNAAARSGVVRAMTRTPTRSSSTAPSPTATR